MPARHSIPRRDPAIAAFLEEIHGDCNRLARLDRDPLALVRPFRGMADREIAAFIASTLAFGQVDLIIDAVRRALDPLGSRPSSRLDEMSEAEIVGAWSGFQYRYCFPADIVGLLLAMKRARAEYGSLEKLFAAGDRQESETGGGAASVAEAAGDRLPDSIVPAVAYFAQRLNELARRGRRAIRPGLVPDPARGSACKRLFLFLRWMVRRDEVDPGGWTSVSPARLVVPLDVHMARVCRDRLGFLRSTTPTLTNALRATECFRLYAPDDPVRYDFALTRPGIDPMEGDERWQCG